MGKCEECSCKQGHKMSCPTQKITVYVEPTAKERAANYMRLKDGFKDVVKQCTLERTKPT